MRLGGLAPRIGCGGRSLLKRGRPVQHAHRCCRRRVQTHNPASRPAQVAGAEAGFSGLGPPRTPVAAAVAMSFVVAAASRPALAGAVAGAEGDPAASLVFTSASAAAAPRPISFAGGSSTRAASPAF
jgi:hypothetical protein